FERIADRGSGRTALRRQARQSSNSDILDRLEALEEFESAAQREFEIGRINLGAAQFVLRSRDQLLRLLRDDLDAPRVPTVQSSPEVIPSDEAILQGVAMAYLDRIARRREPHSRRALMVGGRGVRLLETSAVTDADLFVCVELEETDGAEALVRAA